MGSIKSFFHFLIHSIKETKSEFGVYFPTYVAFLFMNFIGVFPWAGMGYGENSFIEVVTSIVVGLVSLVLVTNIVLIEKSRIKSREKEKLLYAAPTYLIYTLYSSLIILACLSFLMFFPAKRPDVMSGVNLEIMYILGRFFIAAIPAIVAAVCVAMVPLASILIDNDSVNYFILSFSMAKRAPLLIFLIGGCSILIEAPALLIDYFAQDWMTKFAFGFLYAFVDSLIIIILTKASVAIFYHLKKETVGESVY